MITSRSAVPQVVESTISGSEVRMGISAKNMAHIMSIMENMYSDRWTSVLREYTVNGRDACIEAGIQRAVEVTLPTRLVPYLKIRDFGVGLSHDDIHRIYSQYGESTKTNTNDQTGCLGIGSKSAFAVAPQFTVTSVKGGIRIQVVVSKDAQGATMNVVDTSTSNDPSGTEIMIPVPSQDIYLLESKAQNLFRFWPADSVLVNGTAPERLGGKDTDQWITDDILVTDSTGGQAFAVMGGVPYPVKVDHGLRGYNFSVIYYVPIGSLDFAPSREAIMDTDLTKATLARFTQRFRDEVAKSFQKKLDACATKQDALAMLFSTADILPKPDADYTYKGEAFPEGFRLPAVKVPKVKRDWDAKANEYIETMEMVDEHPEFTVVPDTYSRLKDHHTARAIRSSEYAGTIWLYGFDYATWTAPMRKKLNWWLDGGYDNDDNLAAGHRSDLGLYRPNRFVLVESKDDLPLEWIDPKNVVDFAEIAKVKLPRKKQDGTSSRLKGSYDGYVNGQVTWEIPANDIDTDCDIFYLRGNINHASRWASVLTTHFPDCYVIALPANRLGKFERDFPSAVKVHDVLADLKKQVIAGVSEKDKIAAAIQADYNADVLRVLDATKVDDMLLRRWITYSKMDLSTTRNSLRAFAEEIPHADLSKTTLGANNPLSTYPLVPASYIIKRDDKVSDHLYMYLNAAHAAA